MHRLTALPAIALCALAFGQARANCSTSVAFGQVGPNCAPDYCYVHSPGLNTNTSIHGTFWSLTFGNPANGSGDDNGAGSDSSWLLPSPPDHYLGGDWGDAPYDGCGINGPSPLSNKMVVALSDVDATGANAFFAAVCNTRHPLSFPQFDQGDLSPPANIVLKPIAAPVIASTVPFGNEARVTISSPSFTSIYYSDGSAGCGIGSVIKQYDVWLKQVARNAPAPTDRNQSTGAWSLGNACAIGSSCIVTTSCGTVACDAYLAVSPRYDSGFQTGDAPGQARVGPNSTRVQAGLLSAGAVPDGAPDVPLTLAKGAAPLVSLSWGASCSAGAVDYEIYEGALASFTSHASLLCSTAGTTGALITPSSMSSYYLVVPATSSTEGSYGKNSSAVERPASTLACRPQNLGSCP
jgi:hypothetical protein